MPIPGHPDYAIEATDALQVLDPSGNPSPLVIKSTNPFKVAIEFKIKSPLVPLGPQLIYEVKYFAESIGKGPEHGPWVVGPKPTVAGQVTYNATIPPGSETVFEVPAGTMGSGVYRLAAMVSFKLDPGGGVTLTPYDMTVYVERPAIEVYT